MFTKSDFEKIISDPSKWPLFIELLNVAAEIVGDFDSYGEVLQSNEEGMYDETTSVERLRNTIRLISPNMIG